MHDYKILLVLARLRVRQHQRGAAGKHDILKELPEAMKYFTGQLPSHLHSDALHLAFVGVQGTHAASVLAIGHTADVQLVKLAHCCQLHHSRGWMIEVHQCGTLQGGTCF